MKEWCFAHPWMTFFIILVFIGFFPKTAFLLFVSAGIAGIVWSFLEG